MNDHGFVVCAYNRTTEKVDRFLANEAKGKKKELPLLMLVKRSGSCIQELYLEHSIISNFIYNSHYYFF